MIGHRELARPELDCDVFVNAFGLEIGLPNRLLTIAWAVRRWNLRTGVETWIGQ